MAKARVVIIEDEFIIAMSMEFRLETMGYEVCGTFSSGEKCIESFDKIKPEVAIIDINLDGQMDGIKTGKWIKLHREIPVIYLTGYPGDELKERAQAGVVKIQHISSILWK